MSYLLNIGSCSYTSPNFTEPNKTDRLTMGLIRQLSGGDPSVQVSTTASRPSEQGNISEFHLENVNSIDDS